MSVETDCVSRKPRVIACVPTWNAELFIEETLESLAKQTYANLHILISDDNSTDNTYEICRKIADADPRFELSRQLCNVGWTANVNTLLTMAKKADYLFIAGHDDLLHIEFVDALVSALEANAKAVLAYSDMDTTFTDGLLVHGEYRQLDGVRSACIRGVLVLLEFGQWWIPYRGIVRVNTLYGNPGLQRNKAGEFAADWPWVLELALSGQCVRVPRTLCHKIYREGSLSKSFQHTLGQWIAAEMVCIDVIRRSRLTLMHKLLLYACAVIYIPLKALRLVYSYLKRQWYLLRNPG